MYNAYLDKTFIAPLGDDKSTSLREFLKQKDFIQADGSINVDQLYEEFTNGKLVDKLVATKANSIGVGTVRVFLGELCEFILVISTLLDQYKASRSDFDELADAMTKIGLGNEDCDDEKKSVNPKTQVWSVAAQQNMLLCWVRSARSFSWAKDESNMSK